MSIQTYRSVIRSIVFMAGVLFGHDIAFLTFSSID